MNNPRNWYTEALIQGTMSWIVVPTNDFTDEIMPLDPDDEDNYED